VIILLCAAQQLSILFIYEFIHFCFYLLFYGEGGGLGVGEEGRKGGRETVATVVWAKSSWDSD
jgi:hypothetical protein